MTPAAVIALACVKHRRAPLLAGAVQYARSSLVSMQKQTSPSREADNDVRDALESIVLQIEGPEEPRDTKVVSDAHGMVHLSEAVKDTMPPCVWHACAAAHPRSAGGAALASRRGAPRARTCVPTSTSAPPNVIRVRTRALCETSDQRAIPVRSSDHTV